MRGDGREGFGNVGTESASTLERKASLGFRVSVFEFRLSFLLFSFVSRVAVIPPHKIRVSFVEFRASLFEFPISFFEFRYASFSRGGLWNETGMSFIMYKIMPAVLVLFPFRNGAFERLPPAPLYPLGREIAIMAHRRRKASIGRNLRVSRSALARTEAMG